MSEMLQFRNASELPPAPVSLADMSCSRTGSWRFLRAVYRERIAPCQTACPAGTDIRRLMQLVEEEDFAEAYDLIKRTNPLPGICGRVCPHPCELNCNRAQFDEPASIKALERFVADVAYGEGAEIPVPEGIANGEQVAIVGSGPSGLSCAYVLARQGFPVTVYEREGEPGGMLRAGIPRYRMPRDVLEREIEGIAQLGVTFETKTRLGSDLGLEQLWRQYDAVFIATGAHRSRRLGVPGEEEPGVSSGLEFLKAVNAGLDVELGERVLIIGGGNTAIDAARTALRKGARPTIVYRRTRDEMPAIAEEIEEAEEERIEFHFLASPVSFENVGGELRATFIRMKLGEPDASGRRRPEAIPDAEYTIAADQVLTAIGEEPELEFACERFGTSSGLVWSSPRGLLDREGIFLGGDARTGPGTVVEAIASGKKAASQIVRHLGYSAPSEREEPGRRAEVGFDDLNMVYFSRSPRATSPMRPIEERTADFSEIVGAISRQQAVAEARRCFSCGACDLCDNCRVFCPEGAVSLVNGTYEIDLDYCKGCAICAQECPRGAIELVEEA